MLLLHFDRLEFNLVRPDHKAGVDILVVPNLCYFDKTTLLF